MPGDVRFFAPVDRMMQRMGLAYLQNRSRYFAADDLFPYVPFEAWNGTIYVDEALNNMLAGDARGGDEIGFPTVSFRGKGIPFMAEDWGFQSLVTPKQASSSQVAGMSITARRARGLTERVILNREIRAKNIVSAISPDASLATTAKWNSTAPVPRTNIMTGKKQILQFTGREPNKIVFTGTVVDDLITRQSSGSAGALLQDAIKYVMAATGRQINEPLIAAYFDVETVRFWKAVAFTGSIPSAVGGSTPSAMSYVDTTDQAYLVYNEADPGNETSNYGVSPGPTYYGARQFPDPMQRGTWVQVWQSLIEFPAEAKSIYVLGTVL